MPANEERIIQQLSHLESLIKAEFRAISTRLDATDATLKDHEQRIREATTATTQFRLLFGLVTGGGILSLISLVKAFLP